MMSTAQAFLNMVKEILLMVWSEKKEGRPLVIKTKKIFKFPFFLHEPLQRSFSQKASATEHDREISVYPHSCWCFFIDMEKYKQRNGVENILPEQKYWLRKHQTNGKVRP